MDDVLAKGVVLGLDGLEVVLEGVQLADLLLELLDVALFPLAKGALWEEVELAERFPYSKVQCDIALTWDSLIFERRFM